MMTKTVSALFAAAALVALLVGFNPDPSAAQDVTLYKNPQCSCCDGYADYLRQNGFKVNVKPTHELSALSRRAGISEEFQGCHLSVVGGYVVSGHVPVATVRKLLTERPAIKGITLPGMPQGSPGMSGRKDGPWTTYAIGDGAPKPYVTE